MDRTVGFAGLRHALAALATLAVLAEGCAIDDDTAVPAAGGPADARAPDGTDALDCRNECDADGARECRPQGFRTCADVDGDGCLEWSPDEPCAAASRCADGQCVACTRDCDPGTRACGPNGGTQVCETDADSSPCFDWSDEVPCPEAERCSDGRCRPVEMCRDRCLAEGEMRCEHDAIQTCAADPASGCLQWGPAAPCPAEQTCSLGTCRAPESCAHECEPDARRCRLDGFETCGDFDEDPCLEWSGVAPCPPGDTCSFGLCSHECAEECGPAGQTRCSGNGVQTCADIDGDACLDWGPITPCAPDISCSNGACRERCQNECQSDTRRCAQDGVQVCGNYDDDACFEWSEPMPCEGDRACSDGNCTEDCRSECGMFGLRRCGPGGVQTCGDHDADACLEWGPGEACPLDRVCAGGVCADACQNDCAQGSVRCDGDAVQTCGNFNADPCFEWSAQAPCSEGDTCSNGACAAACADECVQGLSRCAEGGVQICGAHDADACADWGSTTPCAPGHSCSNGACSAECTDECARGAARCSHNGVQTCGDYDLDPCADWSTPTPCADGAVCSNGACAAECVDECVVGASHCAGNGLQRCGELDDDGCLEWGAVTPCPVDETCSDGQCAAVCVDECDQGETRCGGSGLERCGDFDADVCFEWSAGVPCADDEVCSDGACAAECADECVLGDTRCDGAGGVQFCADFDSDPCSDWSVTSPCNNGEICVDGACQIQVQCIDDLPCADGQLCVNEVCTPARRCDEDLDCADGERCDAFARLCRPIVPTEIGDPCTANFDCGPDRTCTAPELGGYCTQLCDATGRCPNGSTCYQIDPTGQRVSLCMRDCADAAVCTPGHACFPAPGPLGGFCFVPQCEVDRDCGEDPLIEPRCIEGVCDSDRICDPRNGDADCDGGRICFDFGQVPLCVQPCQLFGDDCRAGEKCAATDLIGNGICLPEGASGPGEPCDNDEQCDATTVCVPDVQGNGICQVLCDPRAADECAVGFCVDLGPAIGACIEPCENECTPGEDRCDAAGSRACGQFDGDLCFDYGPPTPCGDGRGCDEPTGTCRPACTGDDDCRAPVFPASCVNGDCLIRRECEPGVLGICPPSRECMIANEAGTAGACVERCDPLGAPCADGGEACVLFNGDGFCRAPGDIGEGGECVHAADCEGGLVCAPLPAGGGRCLDVCDVAAPDCADGFECRNLGVDPRLGICTEPCRDLCIDGDQRCTPDGDVQRCGHNDGSLCLDWMPTETCPPDQACLPGARRCVEGCLEDRHCSQDFPLFSVCDRVQQTCDFPECALGPNADPCFPDEAASQCLPQSGVFFGVEPGAGFCLVTCDLLDPAPCPQEGANCDYFPVDAQSLEFICMPDGGRGNLSICDGMGQCAGGHSCIGGFADGSMRCLQRCDLRAGIGACDPGIRCVEIAFFPAGVGACVP